MNLQLRGSPLRISISLYFPYSYAPSDDIDLYAKLAQARRILEANASCVRRVSIRVVDELR